MISYEIATYTHVLILPFLNIHSIVLSYPHVYGPEGIYVYRVHAVPRESRRGLRILWN